MTIESQTNDRKKVLILGNGFDLDLGRKTLYKNFYESEYCPKDYLAPLIRHLNEKWVDNLEAVKWYDLENELFNYYSKIRSKGFKFDVFNDSDKPWIDKFIRQDHIAPLNCIRGEANQYTVRRLIEKGILIAPHESSYISLTTKDLFLPPEERDFKALQLIKERLIEYLKIQQGKEINKDSVAAIVAKLFSRDNAEYKQIYSFNYTNIKDVSYDCIFSESIESSIKYVHGNVDNKNVILGTKDSPFEVKYDFLQKTFDTKYNPPAMVYDLLNADDIFIFGHSLGMNDSQYFQAFFEQQSSTQNPQSKNITIFTKDEKSEFAIKRALQEMANYKLSSLFGLNKLQIIKTDELYADHDKFVDVLTDIYSISKYDAMSWIKGYND
jgi:hypothetical protein